MIIIKNRFSEKIIFKSSKKNIKEALEFRVKRGAHLMGASLRGASLIDAHLEGANLTGASLMSANLDGANLMGASLEGADLRGASLIDAHLEGANLTGANLEDAYLKVKTPPINSHNFISEVLLIEAKTEAQIDFSCRVGKQTDQCWKYFIKLAKQKRVLKWALEVLFQWEEFKEKYTEEGG